MCDTPLIQLLQDDDEDSFFLEKLCRIPYDNGHSIRPSRGAVENEYYDGRSSPQSKRSQVDNGCVYVNCGLHLSNDALVDWMLFFDRKNSMRLRSFSSALTALPNIPKINDLGFISTKKRFTAWQAVRKILISKPVIHRDRQK